MPPTQPKLSAPIASPGGWYDAGDFNKYIVNSGITMGTLLSLYEDFPMMGPALEVHIPEQNNDLPDLLDEVLWNLRWMLTMQDPEDGGVYHKLTNAQFDGDVMRVQANKTRYVVQKSSAATLNFVAVLAQSARVFKPFEKQLPGLADSCQQAALRAWGWLGYNPNVHYDQDRLNQLTQPKVLTGAYGDQDVSDEWVWAAAELTVLMQDEKYLKGKNLEKPFVLPSWNQVRGLGYYTLIRSEFMQKHNPALVASLTEKVKGSAGDLIRKINAQPFHTAMGAGERDYVWGSNAVAANQGILLLQAYLRTQDQSFLNAAVGNLDYILGRNATGYCFVTGFGSKRVMHPHHRISMADQIKDPIPGLLSGGPNPGQQDKCKTYPNAFADESYTDDDCSYASNEIAINWNAPLVFLLAGIEGVMR
jgi:endoglucanase